MGLFRKRKYRLEYQDYIQKFDEKVLPIWLDRELIAKIGLKNLFVKKIKIKDVLSYEDACDCLARVSRRLEMSQYVKGRCHEKINQMAAKKDVRIAVSDVLRELMSEAQTKIKWSEVVCPINLEDIMKVLNAELRKLSCEKDLIIIECKMCMLGKGIVYFNA